MDKDWSSKAIGSDIVARYLPVICHELLHRTGSLVMYDEFLPPLSPLRSIY